MCVVTAKKQASAIGIVNKVGVQKEPCLSGGLNGSEANHGRREKVHGEIVRGKICNAYEALKVVVKVESEMTNGTTGSDYICQSAAGARLRLSYPIAGNDSK